MTNNVILEVITEDDRWAKALPDAEALAKRAILSGFAQASYPESVSICVLLTTNSQIQILNQTYRGKDTPTNVLSFPALEMPTISGEPRPLGDIALAYETLDQEAKQANLDLRHHFLHLIVHASLHLIGYTHDTDEDAEHMEAHEIAALSRLGVSNPYGASTEATATDGTQEP